MSTQRRLPVAADARVVVWGSHGEPGGRFRGATADDRTVVVDPDGLSALIANEMPADATDIVLTSCSPAADRETLTAAAQRIRQATGLGVHLPEADVSVTPATDGEPARIHTHERPDGSPTAFVSALPEGRTPVPQTPVSDPVQAGQPAIPDAGYRNTGTTSVRTAAPAAGTRFPGEGRRLDGKKAQEFQEPTPKPEGEDNFRGQGHRLGSGPVEAPRPGAASAKASTSEAARTSTDTRTDEAATVKPVMGKREAGATTPRRETREQPTAGAGRAPLTREAGTTAKPATSASSDSLTAKPATSGLPAPRRARQAPHGDPITEARQTLDELYRMVADWNEQRVQETASAAQASAEAVRQAQAEGGRAPEAVLRRAAADEAAAQAARAEAARWDEQRQAATQGRMVHAPAPEPVLNGGFTGARFVGRHELPTRDDASPLLPTSDNAVIVGGQYRAADNRMYLDGRWRTAAEVAHYVEQRTTWEPGTRQPVVLLAGQAGREHVRAGLPSFAGQVADALNTRVASGDRPRPMVVAPVGQPVQTGPTEIAAGTPVRHGADGMDLRVDTGEGFALNVPGQRRGIPLTHDLGTALGFLGATLEPGNAPPSEPVIWGFGPEAPAGIARYTAQPHTADGAPEASVSGTEPVTAEQSEQFAQSPVDSQESPESPQRDGEDSAGGHAARASLTEDGAPPVPKVVVTGPDEPGDRTPWYLEYGALGQAVVPDSAKAVEFTDEQAELWAQRISERLELPASAQDPTGALRAGIRDAVRDLLLTREPKHWDDLLAAGRTLVVAGRLVWLRPMPRDLTFLPREKKEVKEFPVGFASTQTGGDSGHETSHGADSALFTALNLGAGAAASAAAVAAPQVVVGSSKNKQWNWARTVLSGRKPFINDFNRFSAGLEMRVFVGGEEATPQGYRVTVPDRLQVDLPAPYSAEQGSRPDLVAPEGPRPQRPGTDWPSEAREMLNAVDMTPLIAGLHRSLLAAGLPAPAVKKYMHGLEMDSSKGFLTEPTARNRYQWWSSGDTSNSVEVDGSLLGRKFKGHVRLQAWVDSLQYVGDTNVGSRDDIGVGTNRTATSKGASVGGLGGGYNTAGISGGAADASAAGNDPENVTGPGHEESDVHSNKFEVKGVAPALGGLLTSERSAGHSLSAGHLSHHVLNIFGDQSRYRVGLRLKATVESITHTVGPVEITTESELSVPQREAADFVKRTVGDGWTPDLRPKEDGPQAPRHQVLAPHPPRIVRRLPTARSPYRFDLLGSGDGPRPNPHPREPLPLASRRGFGFSMPIALAGTETLQGDIRAAIAQHHEKAVGARKAKKSDWATADRDLAMFYGRAALDPYEVLLGIHRSIEVGDRRYKVSAKMRWGERINDPNPLAGTAEPGKDPADQTYKMKVNARAVFGATVAGERGRGTKGKFTFGAGARLSVPEHEFHLGGLHVTTPPFRLAIGAVRGLTSYGRKNTKKFSGLAKAYRRTETAGEVHEDRYRMTIQWTVTPEEGKPSYLSGQVPAIARVVTPLEHAPKQPVTPEQAANAGRTRITLRRQNADRPLDFSTGTHGIYPSFQMMPELAQLAARMYAEQHDLPDSWLHDPSQWPEEILDLAHPVILASRFGEMSGPHGHETELPKTGKYKEAFQIKLRIDDPEDLGPSSEIEVEHYSQAAAAYEKEKSGEWELGITGSGGPQFRFGSDAEKGHHSGPGGRVTVQGYGLAAVTTGSGKAETNGRIDITRATYGGDVHTLRGTPVFEVTYRRWRGKELAEATQSLSAEKALDLLVPKRRLADVMPPAAANTALNAVPTIVVTPPGEDPKLTRTYLSPDLIAGVGHPEVMRADGVLDAIFERLRNHGVVTTETMPGAAPRPNLLNRALTASFSSDALETEMHALTTRQGVSRWLPIPGPLGSTRYLWVKVTATRLGPANDQRPRDDVKLTLRGEASHEEARSKNSGLVYGGGLDVRARAGGGGVHGGVEGGAGYSSSRGRTDESIEKTVTIHRANPRDASEEFNHDLTFRVELGTTTELPEFLRLPSRAIDKIAQLYSGQPSHDQGVFQWYDAGDGTEGNSPLVEGGSVRLLVPRHMTVMTDQPAQAIDLTRVRETAVTWEPTARTAPELPQALLEGLHPWSVPAAASIERWAGLTAVRRRTAPELDMNAPPTIGGLNFTTRAGLRYSHFTSGNMLRTHVTDLLRHTYQVPVGSHQVTVGIELDSAEILGPVAGTPLKQRTYEQHNEEPKSERERQSGWDISLGPEMGGSIGEHQMFDRLPVTIKNWLNSRKRSAFMGDTEERNKEAVRPYRQYRFGVTAVINGPHGTIRVKVPGGLYGALPVDAATNKLADGLEDELGGLLAGPASVSQAATPKPQPDRTVQQVPQQEELSVGRGRPVKVPATGECLPYAFMGSDSVYVRDHLPGLAADQPEVYAMLGDPERVRAELVEHARNLSEAGILPVGSLKDAAGAMRSFVLNYLDAQSGALPQQITGQFRRTETAAFETRTAGLDRAGLLALLTYHGVDRVSLPEALEPAYLADLFTAAFTAEAVNSGGTEDEARASAAASAANLAPRHQFAFLEARDLLPSLEELTDDGLRRLLRAVYPASPAPLDQEELAAVREAVDNWDTRWRTPAGEVFLPLLAHAFGVRADVVTQGATQVTTRGPADAGHRIEIHYNRSDHYDASDADPEALNQPPSRAPGSTGGTAAPLQRAPSAPSRETGVRTAETLVPSQVVHPHAAQLPADRASRDAFIAQMRDQALQRRQNRTAQGEAPSDGRPLHLVADLDGTASADDYLHAARGLALAVGEPVDLALVHYDGTMPDHLEHLRVDPDHPRRAAAEQAHTDHQALAREQGPEEEARAE
ncbi:hypothetical protein ABZ646_11640 [Streptomyces sp. NPDC007162]|uniref:hypothetical protein n=1 Tax=Streptomyces sp. NPDC007162 TaxID=3156917 RepID=UPI0033FA74B4